MDIWLIIVGFIIFDVIATIIVLLHMRKPKFSESDRQRFREHWQKIRGQADFKHAVMDADKLLDSVLTRKGYAGSMGEKLSKAEALFSNIDAVWSAHKLRNRLAHELNVSLSDREARMALSQFEKALTDLGAF